MHRNKTFQRTPKPLFQNPRMNNHKLIRTTSQPNSPKKDPLLLSIKPAPLPTPPSTRKQKNPKKQKEKKKSRSRAEMSPSFFFFHNVVVLDFGARRRAPNVVPQSAHLCTSPSRPWTCSVLLLRVFWFSSWSPFWGPLSDLFEEDDVVAPWGWKK